nr:hypothetical protein [Angustibacter aerolatus]
MPKICATCPSLRLGRPHRRRGAALPVLRRRLVVLPLHLPRLRRVDPQGRSRPRPAAADAGRRRAGLVAGAARGPRAARRRADHLRRGARVRPPPRAGRRPVDRAWRRRAPAAASRSPHGNRSTRRDPGPPVALASRDGATGAGGVGAGAAAAGAVSGVRGVPGGVRQHDG